MTQFAKVFDTERTQVLFFYEYDASEDLIVFHQICDLPTMRVDIAIKTRALTIERAAEILAGLTQADAEKLVDYAYREWDVKDKDEGI